LSVFAFVALCLALASAVEVGRPLALHNKLLSRKIALGESVAASVGAEKLERLRVAAAERSESLADKFAEDLEAHVAAKDAAEEDAEVDEEADEGADEEAEEESEEASEEGAESEGALSFESLAALEFVSKKAANDGTGRAKALVSAKTKWGTCLVNSDKTAGVTTLSDVSFKSAPPMRESSFLVNVDGTYKGPGVTAGSMTVQIMRNDKAGPALVYRHSVRLSDVLGHATSYPFKTGDPFTTAIYIPSNAFSLMAKEGDHTLTAVFTNQDKQPFACARLDFNLA